MMNALIEVRDLSKTFTLHQQNGVVLNVLRGVEFSVQGGECLVLHGQSGAGKSTLLRTLYGNYLPAGGSIRVRHAGEWLEPVKQVGLLEVHREAYVASGPNVPLETSTFKTEKLNVQITGKTVEFVPEVMGAGGLISVSVMGLTAARHGSVSLVLPADKNDWLWKKTNGLKDPDTFGFDANFLASQLQSLIPRERG